MNKLVLGLLGAVALGASALPSVAAPAIAAPLSPAVFHADGTDAHVTAVQYRHDYRRHYRYSRYNRHGRYYHGH